MTEFDCRRIFVDTAPFIYLLEDNEYYIEKMKRIFERLIASEVMMFTSTITFEEYLVHPYRTQQFLKVQAFVDFIKDVNVHVITIDTVIAKIAAQIRAEYHSFKAMDALQLASALQWRCDGFLTNDKRLRSFTEIHCLLVDELY